MASAKNNLPLIEYRLLQDRAYVDGEWRDAPARIDVINPATGSVVGSVPALSEGDVTSAVDASELAFRSWKHVVAKQRGAILRRWHDLMLANGDDLARLMTAEQGKPLAEARGEVSYAAAFLDYYAEEARRIAGEILTPHQADRRLLVHRAPVGVVAAVTPWNFPLAMIARKAAPALAAGCTMVLKPSEQTPLSALAMAWLAEQAGVPRGVFNIVTGFPEEVGAVLTSDPRIRKFSFTGSTSVGKMLAARCMASVKRVSLELGGNAPFIIFDDANVDAAIDGLVASKFRNAGQTCVCANRILVQDGIYEVVADKLAARVRAMTLAPGDAEHCDIGPLINEAAAAKVARHVDDAVARGAHVHAAGVGATGMTSNFVEPMVLTGVSRDAMLCREETFGPIAGLIRFSNETEAIEIANDTPMGLAAYFFTRNMDRSWRVREALDFGMVGVNTGLISTEVAPFGGIKESGFGREGARQGIEEYLDTRLTCIGLS